MERSRKVEKGGRPWDQQPGEPDVAYAAFRPYLVGGETPPLSARGTNSRYTKYRWAYRRAAYERHVTDEQLAERLHAQREAHREIDRGMMIAARKSREWVEANEIPPAMVASVLSKWDPRARTYNPPEGDTREDGPLDALLTERMPLYARIMRRVGRSREAIAAIAESGHLLSIEATMELAGLGGSTWNAWRTIARLVDGGSLDAGDAAMARRLLGTDSLPDGKPKELWVAAGRRGGKSMFMGICAATWALRSYPDMIETPRVVIVARTSDQAKEAFGYARSAIDKLGCVAGNPGATQLTTTTGVEITVSANKPSIRGRTYVCVVADEVAFFDTAPAAAFNDRELYKAVKPATATVDAPMMVFASSPWRRAGLLFEHVESRHGKPMTEGKLVVHAPTRVLNPSISQERIEADSKGNPALAAEYLGEFTDDDQVWLPSRVTDPKVVDQWPEERPYDAAQTYVAFADLSGGGGQDRSAIAIAHAVEREGVKHAVIDAILHVAPPFHLDDLAARAREIMGRYKLTRLVADSWAGDLQKWWWQKAGLRQQRSTHTATDIYGATLPAFLNGHIHLLRHRALVEELRGLMMVKTEHGPKITHPEGGHDDCANAVMGAAFLVLRKGKSYIS